MFLRRRFCSSHPCRRSLARCAPDSPAAACGPDAVCAVATAVVEAVRDALPLRLHRAWRWVLLPPAAPTADRSAFRCAGPTLECAVAVGAAGGSRTQRHRSEEHTSELQSHSDLVCRLLLEKKKTTI